MCDCYIRDHYICDHYIREHNSFEIHGLEEGSNVPVFTVMTIYITDKKSFYPVCCCCPAAMEALIES